jgi:O-antigen chain-terminating methyltransferase
MMAARPLGLLELRVNVNVLEGGRCGLTWAAFTATGACVDGSGERFELEPQCLRFSADYAPFEVCGRFVACLSALRPARVVIGRSCGITLELARIAMAFGIGATLCLPAEPDVAMLDPVAARWLGMVLRTAEALLPPPEAAGEDAVRALYPDLPPSLAELPPLVAVGSDAGQEARDAAMAFGYEAYAFGHRDHALLHSMQEKYAAHFAACRRVVDVACGSGIFLEVLARHGISALGVDRNPVSARFARLLGHAVKEADALAWLETHPDGCDGIYCSHFIEHLPIEGAERLMRAVARALRPGGTALFVFPDPESIRSQLLAFWRDPEHVRYYHSELVTALAASHGLELEFDAARDDPEQRARAIAPFTFFPPPLGELPSRGRRWSCLLERLGIAPMAALRAERQRAAMLEEAVRQLWAVNQTWAWDSNAALRFRRPLLPVSAASCSGVGTRPWAI